MTFIYQHQDFFSFHHFSLWMFFWELGFSIWEFFPFFWYRIMFQRCTCAWDIHTHTPTHTHTYKHTLALCVGPSENTHILSLSLMVEEMLTQTYKQNPHPKHHYICMLFLELRFGLQDLTYPAAPPPLLSSLSLSQLRPYLIVCLFSLAAPNFRSQAGR